MEPFTGVDQSLSKKEKYETLIPQIKALLTGEDDRVANLANISAALKFGMDFFWVGFYLVKDDQLVLGPFQGPTACTRIQRGRGVCGTAWQKKETLIVPDVNAFSDHIACSALTQSEIVIPVVREGTVEMVLDVDSIQPSDFDKTDQKYLQTIVDLIP